MWAVNGSKGDPWGDWRGFTIPTGCLHRAPFDMGVGRGGLKWSVLFSTAGGGEAKLIREDGWLAEQGGAKLMSHYQAPFKSVTCVRPSVRPVTGT